MEPAVVGLPTAMVMDPINLTDSDRAHSDRA